MRDQTIVSLLEEGLSANKIQESLKGTLLGQNRQILLRRIGELKELPYKSTLLRGIKHKEKIPRVLTVPAGGYQSKRYRYVVHLDIRNPDTGGVDVYYRNVSSNTLLTSEEALAYAKDNLSKNLAKSNPNVLGGYVNIVYRQNF